MFNSMIEEAGKSHHCNYMKGDTSHSLSVSTIGNCPVSYPTKYMHQTSAEIRKCMPFESLQLQLLTYYVNLICF